MLFLIIIPLRIFRIELIFLIFFIFLALHFCSLVIELGVGILLIDQVYIEIIFIRWWCRRLISVVNPRFLIETIDNRFSEIKGSFSGGFSAPGFVNIHILLIGPLESQHWKNNTLRIVAKHGRLLCSHVPNEGKNSWICKQNVLR